MAARFDSITFLSDYGTGDEFVGVVHSVIRSIAPHVTVIDLTHEIAPYDVRAGSLTLGRAAQYLRSEEHTSELQSLMRISYAVFCLNKKTLTNQLQTTTPKHNNNHQ